MTASHSASTNDQSAASGLRVLLYSDDVTTRDKVRLAVGRRPARDVTIESWHEVATGPMVVRDVERGDFDLLILAVAATAPVMVFERTSRAGERTVEHICSWYRGDRYQVHMSLDRAMRP